MNRYWRALGWGAFAGAPVMLASLAVAVARPDAPSLIRSGVWVAWIAGAIAFAASILHARGARASKVAAVFSALVVLAWCAFLVWVAAATA